ncbi:FixH family protein [Pararhizobium antarcticum]|uniref:Cytochrome oxidase n=1 Tax=Pararhizobium antarcticum TaxID=1798805 RepID=A0A657LQN3_9HYPH|nr:FixH family protein [Pararhizobium antarcticum]OJF92755.1 cytochrome oxidase [Rhizobium sp. 58]OJF95117.1 cytochrome oxidase [Pararhizobium antarcticum]
MSTNPQGAEFTGRHMLLIMLAFFGVIIAVNLGMARLAGSSFGGLVVKNSYVASQEFNGKLEQSRQQLALGWTTAFSVADGTITYRLTDRDGRAVQATAVSVQFRHPSYEAADWSVALKPAGDGRFEAAHTAPNGIWIVQIDSEVGRVAPYRDVRRITIRNGAFQ